MSPSEAQSKLADALLNVKWHNLIRVMDTLAKGNAWGRYDNNTWRPNYKQVELDLPWLLDNFSEVCEALQVLKEQPKS